jgi:hypothetical protein
MKITGMNPKASFGNKFRSKLRGIKLLLMRDNSANILHCASLLKFESHYPPLRVIVQLTNSAAPIVTFRLFAFGIGVSTIKHAIKRRLCEFYKRFH